MASIAHTKLPFDLTVLLVEDEPIMRRLIGEMLKNILRSVTIIEAQDGSQALYTMQMPGNKPDLIVTDLCMEPMNGRDMVQAIRHRGIGDRYIPIILATSDTSMETVEQALCAGIDDLLPKPLSLHTLRDRLHRVLTSQNEFVEVPHAFGKDKHYFGPLTSFAKKRVIRDRPYQVHCCPNRYGRRG